MIRVTNGVKTTLVTMGAFKEIYEPMGYKPWAPPDSPQERSLEPRVEEPEAETPISEMRLEDLKAYAAQNGIDISEAKTKRDIKNIIRAEVSRRRG